MHIVWVSENPALKTGYGMQTAQLVDEFVKMGHKVSIIAYNYLSSKKVSYYNGVTPVYPLPFNATEYDFRKIISMIEKPMDIFVVFTDIHFVHCLFPDNENDIKQHCPFVLYHLWDNDPPPLFNKNIYGVLDKVICGSKFSYDLLGGFVDNLDYVPLGCNPDLFKPQCEDEVKYNRKSILGKFDDRINFIVGSINANIMRKRLGDLFLAFNKFASDKSDVALLLHCDVRDKRGIDLELLCRVFVGDNSGKYFINSHPTGQSFQYMNNIYNICDVMTNIAHSEGFGLQTVEGLQAGKPSILGNFGNNQYLIKDKSTGWLLPSVCDRLIGGFGANYIYEHYVSEMDLIDTWTYIYNNRDILSDMRDDCRKAGEKYDIRNSAKQLLQSFNNTIQGFSRKSKNSYSIEVV